ncbi:unnamed protein product [Paramecium primaurelia]|uniref:Uncharacterized protein n=1 Tax=Paramecium primaurelia TaxID=5886 RepID=A0A8S1QHQ0_PARPR|nr:unnamed protein product [Paramecium primaurelia]
MLKSITRRRKKYIFLDYLIVLFTSLYLRIRTIDMDFYSSIQPNYLWLLTILFGLMFAKIGRVWCIFICVNLNLLSIYYFNNTNNIVFATSIYKLTYDSLILLVICHSFNIFRDKGFQVLTYCYAFGKVTVKQLRYLLIQNISNTSYSYLLYLYHLYVQDADNYNNLIILL